MTCMLTYSMGSHVTKSLSFFTFLLLCRIIFLLFPESGDFFYAPRGRGMENNTIPL